MVGGIVAPDVGIGLPVVGIKVLIISEVAGAAGLVSSGERKRSVRISASYKTNFSYVLIECLHFLLTTLKGAQQKKYVSQLG